MNRYRESVSRSYVQNPSTRTVLPGMPISTSAINPMMCTSAPPPPIPGSKPPPPPSKGAIPAAALLSKVQQKLEKRKYTDDSPNYSKQSHSERYGYDDYTEYMNKTSDFLTQYTDKYSVLRDPYKPKDIPSPPPIRNYAMDYADAEPKTEYDYSRYAKASVPPPSSNTYKRNDLSYNYHTGKDDSLGRRAEYFDHDTIDRHYYREIPTHQESNYRPEEKFAYSQSRYRDEISQDLDSDVYGSDHKFSQYHDKMEEASNVGFYSNKSEARQYFKPSESQRLSPPGDIEQFKDAIAKKRLKLVAKMKDYKEEPKFLRKPEVSSLDNIPEYSDNSPRTFTTEPTRAFIGKKKRFTTAFREQVKADYVKSVVQSQQKSAKKPKDLNNFVEVVYEQVLLSEDLTKLQSIYTIAFNVQAKLKDVHATDKELQLYVDKYVQKYITDVAQSFKKPPIEILLNAHDVQAMLQLDRSIYLQATPSEQIKEPYICNHCQLSYPPQKYICNQCNTKFITKVSLLHHRLITHQDDFLMDFTSTFNCDMCGNFQTPSIEILKTHTFNKHLCSTTHEECPYGCRLALPKKMLLEHIESTHVFACYVCKDLILFRSKLRHFETLHSSLVKDIAIRNEKGIYKEVYGVNKSFDTMRNDVEAGKSQVLKTKTAIEIRETMFNPRMGIQTKAKKIFTRQPPTPVIYREDYPDYSQWLYCTRCCLTYPKQGFSCTICSELYWIEMSLLGHKILHHSMQLSDGRLATIGCNICRISFSNNPHALAEHIQLNHVCDYDHLPCPDGCLTLFKDQAALVSHTQIKHSYTQCNICDEGVKGDLTAHYREKHKLYAKSTNIRKLIDGPFNDLIIYENRAQAELDFIRDSKEHSLVKPFVNVTLKMLLCDSIAKKPFEQTHECSKCHVQYSYLGYPCNACPLKFNIQIHLQMHLHTYHKMIASRLECKLCPDTKYFGSNMKAFSSHVFGTHFCKLHLMCPFNGMPQCNKLFVTPENARAHVREFHRRRCPYCDTIYVFLYEHVVQCPKFRNSGLRFIDSAELEELTKEDEDDRMADFMGISESRAPWKPDIDSTISHVTSSNRISQVVDRNFQGRRYTSELPKFDSKLNNNNEFKIPQVPKPIVKPGADVADKKGNTNFPTKSSWKKGDFPDSTKKEPQKQSAAEISSLDPKKYSNKAFVPSKTAIKEPHIRSPSESSLTKQIKDSEKLTSKTTTSQPLRKSLSETNLSNAKHSSVSPKNNNSQTQIRSVGEAKSSNVNKDSNKAFVPAKTGSIEIQKISVSQYSPNVTSKEATKPSLQSKINNEPYKKLTGESSANVNTKEAPKSSVLSKSGNESSKKSTGDASTIITSKARDSSMVASRPTNTSPQTKSVRGDQKPSKTLLNPQPVKKQSTQSVMNSFKKSESVNCEMCGKEFRDFEKLCFHLMEVHMAD